MVRKQYCKSKQHRKIDKIGNDRYGLSQDKPASKPVDDIQDNAGNIEYVEFRSAPLAFKRTADEIVEIERDDHEKYLVVDREKYPGDEAPDLTVEDTFGTERQPGNKLVSEKENDCGDKDDIDHQPWDAEPAMFPAKSVDSPTERSQCCSPLNC